jgi:hypothetical protein
MGFLKPRERVKIHQDFEYISPVTGRNMRNVNIPDVISHDLTGWEISYYDRVKEAEISDLLDRSTEWPIYKEWVAAGNSGPLPAKVLRRQRNLLCSRQWRYHMHMGGFSRDWVPYQMEKALRSDPSFVPSKEPQLIELIANVVARLSREQIEHVSITKGLDEKYDLTTL